MSYSVTKLLSVAAAEVGYLEKISNSNLNSKTENAGPGDFTKYARDLHGAGYYNGNKIGFAWCDIFNDWCHYMAAGGRGETSRDIAQSITYQTGTTDGAGCTFSMRNYKNAGQFFYSPLPGDQLFIKDDESPNNPNLSSHTGIVYKVDNVKKLFYTVEGNSRYGVTNLNDILGNPNTTAQWTAKKPGVYYKCYSFNDNTVLGFGRPKYSDSGSTQIVFNQNTEAVQSATKHNFFTTTLITVSSMAATIKIATSKRDAYKWSYTLTNLLNNTSSAENIAIAASALNAINLSNLKPNTPYSFKVMAKSNTLTSSQQLFFCTSQLNLDSVSDLNATFGNKVLEDDSCKLVFTLPSSLKKCSTYGYRINLLLNGRIVSYEDIIAYSSDSKIVKSINFTKLGTAISAFTLNYGDSIQLGIQTWATEADGTKKLGLLNSTLPVFISTPSKAIKDIFITSLDKVKNTILWLNS